MDTSTGPVSSPVSFRTPPTRQLRCRRKFLRFFGDGFHDTKYLASERRYKQLAHEQWHDVLAPNKLRALLKDESHAEVVRHALRIEGRTNLLHPFEKMAVRDALRTDAGARAFARGLHVFLYGSGSEEQRFDRWCAMFAALSLEHARIFTWPIVTVFGFIAQPDRQIFLRPSVMRRAAAEYGFDLRYAVPPSFETYGSLLDLAAVVKHDLRDLRPRDMIDVQSFLWVMGSDEY